ncbi:hypothetical protein [Methylobacterium thuringiense]|uniref:DUF2313 domain-containing protein n=1 Tax=Methylobacterium thuringiense TaxID=1003091 RepID=A0ABQ4TIZ8_9HYPH|nr:hypothetical protein [Methylobacterium thuringiense]GJE54588.1 hypothetical protein EKPJFOCH_1066 [Methylobacterium thuringiense]
MSDCLSTLDPEYCPDLDDCHAELRALLPRGKAWEAAYNPAAILWGFWRAVAHPIQFAHQRICDIRRQFWCQSVDELYDEWLVEYGLPDACDPFPDLCAKVAALGGTQCEYYEAVAARAGWRIECSNEITDCGGLMDLMRMDCAVTGGEVYHSRLTFRVYLNDSPAYVASANGPLVMDCNVLNAVFGCDPDIGPLQCLLERIVPAHVELIYALTYPQEVLGTEAMIPVTTEDGTLIPVNR